MTPQEGGSTSALERARAVLFRRKQISEGTKPATPKGWVKAAPWLEHAVHTMLHDREPVVGVDITPGHIRVCVMEEQDGRWEIRALGGVNIEADQTLQEVRQHEAMYVEALKKLLEERNIDIRYAAIALPVTSSIVRTATTANLADKDIEAAIATGTFWQSVIQLSVKLKDYSVYYEILSRDEKAGTMDLLFVAARNADIALYTGILTRAGLVPMVADVHCFALQNAFRLNREEEIDGGAPTALLKFGTDENYLLLTDRGKPYLYEIYIQDNERETIGEQLGNPEFVQRFATQVKQIIVKHTAKNPGCGQVQRVRMVSLLPGLEGFVDALSQTLWDYPVMLWNPFRHVTIPPELAEAVKTEPNPAAWTIPMGLAVRSLTIVDWFHHADTADHVNFLGQAASFIKAQRVGVFSKVGLSLYTVIALVLAVVMAVAVMHEASSVNRELKALQSIEQEHKEKSTAVDGLKGRLKKIQALETFIAQNPSDQKVLLDIYRHASQVIPEGVWLSRIQFSPPYTVEMTGKALDDAGILEFIRGLEKNDRVSRVTLKTMQAEETEGGPEVKGFTLSCTVAELEAKETARLKAEEGKKDKGKKKGKK